MGGVPSTPRWGSAAEMRPAETAEYLIGALVGEKSYPLASDYWQKLLESPLHLRWPSHRVLQASQLFAQNNCKTRHLAKILVHLAWCLQECVSASGVPSAALVRALNALYISSVFLKYFIENAKSDHFEELHLSLDENEAKPTSFSKGGGPGRFQVKIVYGILLAENYQTIEQLVMHSVLSFLGKVDVSTNTYLLHHELLNFMLIAMSTQLLSGPSPGPDDSHPFIDAMMVQESSLVSLVVSKLLLNYIRRPNFPIDSSSYSIFSEVNQTGVLQRVGSAAANFVLLPFNLFVGSSGEATRSPLAENSLNVLLILIHYRKCIETDYVKDRGDHSSEPLPKEDACFSENPYCKALENAQDIEFDRLDVEGNVQNGPLVRLPFASLFDTLGLYLADERSILLLYSMVQGNSAFLEYVLVRTDLDTLLMPMLETLYNASRRTSNQIYMVLIILLILSQDSSFNASIHKLMLPNVPWYQERLLHQTSLGSLMVIILIRTVKYNLSKLRQDVYLHTNCLATLANMAPHVHRLSAYASQRLVSLFDMLARKYNKLAEMSNNKMHMPNGESREEDNLPEDTTAELHIYTDFLRIVLEILNAILTYTLPRNPEVVYAIMHRQEVFQPFRNHPRFNELLENIFTVLDFFNSRMDAQKMDGEWSVEKVLQVIVINCRSWRGEGMKMFTQLRFTYEQESHPEEFFIPYVWQLVLSCSSFSFNPNSINLFPVDLPLEDSFVGEDGQKLQSGGLNGLEQQVDVLV
ncbi:uncharacterized protein [Coffea arabica]|uniref:Dymeclin n=1 Tax=Coffea arabica TaxID=13443 RepID=A0ABM4X940_COFAR